MSKHKDKTIVSNVKRPVLRELEKIVGLICYHRELTVPSNHADRLELLAEQLPSYMPKIVEQPTQ